MISSTIYEPYIQITEEELDIDLLGANSIKSPEEQILKENNITITKSEIEERIKIGGYVSLKECLVAFLRLYENKIIQVEDSQQEDDESDEPVYIYIILYIFVYI